VNCVVSSAALERRNGADDRQLVDNFGVTQGDIHEVAKEDDASLPQ
jgi:hypothetical protein